MPRTSSRWRFGRRARASDAAAPEPVAAFATFAIVTDPFRDDYGYLTELPEELPGQAEGGSAATQVAASPRGPRAARGDRSRGRARRHEHRRGWRGRRRGEEGGLHHASRGDHAVLSRRLEAASGTGSDRRVPRDPASRVGRPVSAAVRAAGRLPAPDAVARGQRVRGGHARPGGDRLVRARGAPAEADRRQLRRRLPEPVRRCLPGAAAARLEGSDQPGRRRGPTCRTRTSRRCSMPAGSSPRTRSPMRT